MIMSIYDLLFRDLDRSCVVSINWVSVECLLCWLLAYSKVLLGLQ